ncbi:protein kinase domain-containing protein [Citrus sinensis]|nr:protein kinase domain-containing protein [Citrus sinensis]
MQDRGQPHEELQNCPSLRGLVEIDLSCYSLFGKVPQIFSKLLSLRHVNLSYIDLDSVISNEQIFANASAISLLGNDKLRGGSQELHLPKCFKISLKIVILVVDTEFWSSCAMTRKSLRRRNILRITTACSSVDYKGNDFKALRLNIAIDVASALDYLHNHYDTPIARCDLKPSNELFDEDMIAHVGGFGLANSSLKHQKILQKSICIYWAQGFYWLHPSRYYCQLSYSDSQSCFYMSRRVSMLRDIYSYGIVLLETFTGKRPTDDMFNDDFRIHVFCEQIEEGIKEKAVMIDIRH